MGETISGIVLDQHLPTWDARERHSIRIAATPAEVLAAARVTGRSSLLFLDADATRERLKANSWIADATVRKLLPGQLQIEIKEREPFALWLKDRRVSVVADDGTVLEGFVAPQLLSLPLVVGRGAETRAKDFLALLDRFAALRDHFFRYVKIEAKTLLHDMAEARASIPAADMTSYLDRFDLKLIVEKVDDEASLERLMDYGVDLAEGDLFARPRPVTPEMFRELAEADAA